MFLERGLLGGGQQKESASEVAEESAYEEQPVQILDKEEKLLRNKAIPLVKILWRNHSVEEATWEREDEMRIKYPALFGE